MVFEKQVHAYNFDDLHQDEQKSCVEEKGQDSQEVSNQIHYLSLRLYLYNKLYGSESKISRQKANTNPTDLLEKFCIP